MIAMPADSPQTVANLQKERLESAGTSTCHRDATHSRTAADDDRSTITLSGDSQEINSTLDMISIFDVDMMRGKSVVAVSVCASPEVIASDLRSIFGFRQGRQY
jgi:hypothetical protein